MQILYLYYSWGPFQELHKNQKDHIDGQPRFKKDNKVALHEYNLADQALLMVRCSAIFLPGFNQGTHFNYVFSKLVKVL